ALGSTAEWRPSALSVTFAWNVRMKVLVVDDDPDIVAPVARALTNEGFGVLATTTGRSARKLAQEWSPDVVIVGDAPPDEAGLDVVIDLREHDPVAHVIMVGDGDTHMRVRALMGGADDYLDTSCSAVEVAARVHGVARRRRRKAGDPVLAFGPLVIDLGARTVTLSERTIPMAARELDLLAH